MRSSDERVVENGSWQLAGSGQYRYLTLHPKTFYENGQAGSTETEQVVDGRRKLTVGRAHLQALLDDGLVSSRAELARRLGVSRARVTQLLGAATDEGGRK